MLDLVGAPSPLRTFGFLSLWRRWRFIGTCGVLSLIVGVLFTVVKPEKYTSSTQLLVYVRELQPGPELIISPGSADLTQVQNEIEIVRSRGMLVNVARSLDLSDDDEFVPRPTLFQTLANWASIPAKATFEKSFVKLDIAVESLEKLVKVQRVGASHTILVSVTTSDANKSERIANAIGQVAQQARVNVDQEDNRSPLLRERLQGLGPSAYVITAARAPEQPDGHRTILIISMAAIAGLVIGSALALLQDFQNRTMRTAAQVEYFGMDCVGAIPRLRRRRIQRANRSMSKGGSGEAHEFLPHAMLHQTLRRVAVAVESPKLRVIGVTSVVAGEGATTVAQCFAQLMVRSQKKVLLVDASRIDPIRPLELAHVSEHGQRTRGDIVLDEPTGLDILKASSSDMGNAGGAAVWRAPYDQHCLDAYDSIVVALPPLESGPEFRMAAQGLDGILLVLKWGSTTLDKVEQALAGSDVGPSEFIGAVLNMVDERMVGKFGDKLWEAEAKLVAKRRPLEFRFLAS